ncbi:MAG: hypothetical protein U0793_16070 [Gemmataceae bacterium]
MAAADETSRWGARLRKQAAAMLEAELAVLSGAKVALRWNCSTWNRSWQALVGETRLAENSRPQGHRGNAGEEERNGAGFGHMRAW